MASDSKSAKEAGPFNKEQYFGTVTIDGHSKLPRRGAKNHKDGLTAFWRLFAPSRGPSQGLVFEVLSRRN
jgi:hypothetical protein